MKDLMPMDKIIARLEGMKLSYVVEKTGVSYPTLKKVRAGRDDIMISTWRRLSDFFEGVDSI